MTLRVVDPSGGPRALMLAYCEERGISEARADAAGFKPLDVATTMARAGSANALGRCSFEIPYYDLDGKPTGHSRLRFLGEPSGFKPTKERKRAPKFWQEPGTGTPAYIPPGFARSIALDPSLDVYVTEGEIKSLAATLLGIRTIAIGGVDTWHVAGDPSTLVPGLSAIDPQGRNFGIVFDSDAARNPNVQRAEAALCAELARRSAFPRVIRLPPTKDGGKQGLDDYLVAEGPEAFRHLVASADRLPDALDTGTTLLDTDYPPVEFAIEPYLPKGELIELHGAHGIGKSTVALYAALSVATGENWNDCPVKQGKAVFISLEDRSATLALRVKAWLAPPPEYVDAPDHAAAARNEKAIKENFRFLGREKAAPLVLTEAPFNRPYVRTAVVGRLVKLCAGAQLVVLETASRLNPVGEGNVELAVFASALEEIATRTGAAVVLVRHVSKEVARSGSTDSLGGRGGAALADAARSVLSVERQKPEDPIRLVHSKSTHTARGEDLLWRFEPTKGHGVRLYALDARAKQIVKDQAILTKLKDAGEDGITASKLQADVKRKMDGATLRAALERLVKEGHAVEESVKGRSGPPRKVYRASAVVRAMAVDDAP